MKLRYIEKRLLNAEPHYILAIEDALGCQEVSVEMRTLPDREHIARMNRLAALIKSAIIEQFEVCLECEGEGHYVGFRKGWNEPDEIRCEACGGEP